MSTLFMSYSSTLRLPSFNWNYQVHIESALYCITLSYDRGGYVNITISGETLLGTEVRSALQFLP